MKIFWMQVGQFLPLNRFKRIGKDISFNLFKTSQEKIEWYLDNLKETRNILIEDQEKLLSFYNQISDILQAWSLPLPPECLHTVHTLLSETETLMKYHSDLSSQREEIALKIDWCVSKYYEVIGQQEEEEYKKRQLLLLQN